MESPVARGADSGEDKCASEGIRPDGISQADKVVSWHAQFTIVPFQYHVREVARYKLRIADQGLCWCCMFWCY